MNIKLFNPTGWNAEVKAMGEEFQISAFGEIGPEEYPSLYDVHKINHIAMSFKHLGIVPLEYGPKAREKYKTYEDYKSAQELKGLENVLRFKEDCLAYELGAEKDIKEHKGTQMYARLLNRPRFEKDIELIKKWITEAGGHLVPQAEAHPVETERKEWRNKVEKNEHAHDVNTPEAPRRGRPRKIDEFGRNQDSSSQPS